MANVQPHSSLYIAYYQTERLLVASRLMLAAFIMLASSQQPLLSSVHSDTLPYVIYFGVAVLLLGLSWQHYRWLHYLGLLTHLLDLALLAWLLVRLDRLSDYHYLHMLFPILTASLRWGWRGMSITLLAVVAGYIGLVIHGHWSGHGHWPASPLSWPLHLAVLGGHVLAVFMLLGYLVYQCHWQRQELIQLANWPRNVPDESLSHVMTQSVATIFQAPRVIMVWHEPDEPWLNLSYYRQGQVVYSREPPSAFQPLVAAELQDKHFLSLDVSRRKPVLVYHDHSRQQPWEGTPLNTLLQQQYTITSVLALRLASPDVDGWVLVLDRDNLCADDLLLGAIVARQIIMDMGAMYQQRDLPKARPGVSEEGVQLARNLHDGLLQNLTSIALKLQAIQVQWQRDPAAVPPLLHDLQHTIAREQSELRSFVDSYKPLFRTADTAQEPAKATLIDRLRELTRCIGRDWPILVESAIRGSVHKLPTELEDDLYHIVREALINAARHSHCTRVHLSIDVRGHQAWIIVEDDGRGFTFRGRRTLAELRTMNQEPVSLSSRISQLKGQLIIDSSSQGSRLQVQLPLAQAKDA